MPLSIPSGVKISQVDLMSHMRNHYVSCLEKMVGMGWHGGSWFACQDDMAGLGSSRLKKGLRGIFGGPLIVH